MWSLIHMLSLPQAESEVYCREERIERYRKYGGRVRFLRLHALAHHILIPFISIEHFLGGRRLHIIRDDRMATLKWELIEQIPQVKRCEVPETAYDVFVNRMRFLFGRI